MTFTPFSEGRDLRVLRERGINITNDVNDCDIIISRTLDKLMSYRLRFRSQKKYLIWTHEPRYNIHFQSRLNGFLWLPDVFIMNTYTGDAFLDNYVYLLWKSGEKKYHPMSICDDKISDLENRKIVTIMTFKDSYNKKRWSVKRDGEELDLIYLRTQIATLGYRLGCVDIYGKGWPNNLSLGESREHNWCRSKKEILNKYSFNLCFENTIINNYCTEKIWDSIQSYCLPIYYGKHNTIYNDFPKKSFLDYADFKGPEHLFSYIQNMSVDEFRDRLNTCIDVFNKILKSNRPEQSWEKRINHTAKKIQEFMDN